MSGRPSGVAGHPARMKKGIRDGFLPILEAENRWELLLLDIADFRELHEQAKYLSYAEGANRTKLVKGDVVLCLIGIRFNPRFNAANKTALLDQYQKQLVAEKLGMTCILKSSNPSYNIMFLMMINLLYKNHLSRKEGYYIPGHASQLCEQNSRQLLPVPFHRGR